MRTPSLSVLDSVVLDGPDHAKAILSMTTTTTINSPPMAPGAKPIMVETVTVEKGGKKSEFLAM